MIYFTGLLLDNLNIFSMFLDFNYSVLFSVTIQNCDGVVGGAFPECSLVAE